MNNCDLNTPILMAVIPAVRRRFCPGCTSLQCRSSSKVTGSPRCFTTGAVWHATTSWLRCPSPPRVNSPFRGSQWRDVLCLLIVQTLPMNHPFWGVLHNQIPKKTTTAAFCCCVMVLECLHSRLPRRVGHAHCRKAPGRQVRLAAALGSANLPAGGRGEWMWTLPVCWGRCGLGVGG